jgi:hypothetical protein
LGASSFNAGGEEENADQRDGGEGVGEVEVGRGDEEIREESK